MKNKNFPTIKPSTTTATTTVVGTYIKSMHFELKNLIRERNFRQMVSWGEGFSVLASAVSIPPSKSSQALVFTGSFNQVHALHTILPVRMRLSLGHLVRCVPRGGGGTPILDLTGCAAQLEVLIR